MATSIFKPVTVITGASVGIGAALARVFARNGHEVALVARREQEMVLLATEIAVWAKHRPHVITADLQRSDAPARIAHELLGRGLEPAVVVNNAGFRLRAGLDLKSPPRLLGRTAEHVAQAGYDGFTAGTRLVIPGVGNKIISLLPKLLPRGLVLRTLESYQRNRGRRAEGWRKAKP